MVMIHTGFNLSLPFQFQPSPLFARLFIEAALLNLRDDACLATHFLKSGEGSVKCFA